jgi:hypothetical protein
VKKVRPLPNLEQGKKEILQQIGYNIKLNMILDYLHFHSEEHNSPEVCRVHAV